MNRNNTIYYDLILDRSGSMASHAMETLQGLNNQIRSIKKLQRENPSQSIFVSVTLFNGEIQTMFKNIPALQLRELTMREYNPNGNTALLDAVGYSIERITELAGRRIANDEASATIMVLTDGQENASVRYSKREIAQKIEALERTENWSFGFIGAGIDAWDSASQMNFKSGNVVSVSKDNIQNAFSMINDGLSELMKRKMEGRKSSDVFNNNK